jgi:hypothetical protein
MTFGLRAASLGLALFDDATGVSHHHEPFFFHSVPAPGFHRGITGIRRYQRAFARHSRRRHLELSKRRWIRRDSDARIHAQGRRCLERPNHAEIGNKNVKKTNIQYFTKELNSLDVTSDQYKRFFPKYDFPLTVGKAWNKEFTATRPSGLNYSGIVHAKVVGVEDVTVPAGTFSCFRIVYEIEAFTADSSANATKGNLTIWYAPAVNNAVKSETVRSENGRVRGKEVTELVAYISPAAKMP